MLDAVGAGGKVVASRYGEEVRDMRAQLLQQLLGLGLGLGKMWSPTSRWWSAGVPDC